MSKKIQILRNKFKKYNIDGYIVPKNDDYFTEYSKINRLKIISNFSGSSAKINSGFIAMARAIATLCCSPPDNWLGKLLNR